MISIKKLSLKDKKNLLDLFINQNDLRDTGINISKEKINLVFVEGWLRDYIKQYSLEKPNFLVYGVYFNNKIIGTIGVGNVNYFEKAGVIGYWISDVYCGKGYCTKAIKLFLKKIKRVLSIKQITAEVSNSNPASVQVLEKNGFNLEKRVNNKLFYFRSLKLN
jgi:RimJ/RimL family protein N-acetyltransferase